MRADERARELVGLGFDAAEPALDSESWWARMGASLREAVAEDPAGTMFELARIAKHAFTEAAGSMDARDYFKRWAVADAADNEVDDGDAE